LPEKRKAVWGRIRRGLLIALLSGCVSSSVQGQEFWGEAMALPTGVDAPHGPGKIVSAFTLRSTAKDFGGISGAALAPDGETLSLVSDRGSFFDIRLWRDRQGDLSGLQLLRKGRLAGIDGTPLVGRNTDAEELTFGDSGFLVSFERFHRLRLYRHGLDQPAEAIELPLEAHRLPENTGIEALALLPDRRLLLMSEDLEDGAASVWRGTGGNWRKSLYMPRPSYRPTGAAALPDGSILVVERHFSLLGGFSALLARAVPPVGEDGAWTRMELLSLEHGLFAENFEAVTIWRDPAGKMRAYLLADDNFSPFQSSLLLEILLP
jgi:hypothetical protein